MSTETFDAIVLGAGMAGLTVARRAAKAGRRVAIVDTRPYGGTCALRGCDPKKVLIGAAEIVDRAARLRGKGIADTPSIVWRELMAFKRTFTEPVPERLDRSLQAAGVTTLHGSARFVGPNTLVVGERELEAARIVVAVGSRPRPLAIEGAEHVATSTAFLDLEALPRSIAFIGGGFVSLEFAHIAVRAGTEAAVLHSGPHVLPGFDPRLVDALIEASRDVGVTIETQREVTRVDATSSGFTVHAPGGDPVEADLVVHGAGRVPELQDLDLEAGGVAFDAARGVLVDQHLRSMTNPAVYAAGDAAASDGWPLTPVAVHEGFVVAANLFGAEQTTPNYTGTPSVVFTIPALARVGLLESEAQERGLDVIVRHRRTEDWYSARRTNQRSAAYTIIEDRNTGQVLGAHLLGDHAGEAIDMFALAVRHGLRAHDLKTSILVHPSDASDVAYMV